MEPATSIEAALEHVAKKLHASSPNNVNGNEVCIVIPNILLQDDAAVQKYLEAFDGLCQHCSVNEPETLKFAAFRASKDGSIWALEHFTSEAALAFHRSSAQLQDMFTWLQTEKPNGDHPLPMPVPLTLLPGCFTHGATQSGDGIQLTVYVVEAGEGAISRLHANSSHLKARSARLQQSGILMGICGTTDTQVWHLIAGRQGPGCIEAIRVLAEELRAEFVGCDIREIRIELAVGFIAR